MSRLNSTMTSGSALVAARAEGADAGHGVDGLFDALGDFALDDLGAGAGVVHAHHHGGHVDVGELVQAQALVAEQAQHHEGQHHHHRHHGVLDGDAREPHGTWVSLGAPQRPRRPSRQLHAAARPQRAHGTAQHHGAVGQAARDFDGALALAVRSARHRARPAPRCAPRQHRLPPPAHAAGPVRCARPRPAPPARCAAARRRWRAQTSPGAGLRCAPARDRPARCVCPSWRWG